MFLSEIVGGMDGSFPILSVAESGRVGGEKGDDVAFSMLAAEWRRGECSESSLIEDDDEKKEDGRGFEPILRLCAKFLSSHFRCEQDLKFFGFALDPYKMVGYF